MTYSSLIASSEKGRSRLQQLVQWYGPDYDGLIVFDEVLQFCRNPSNLNALVVGDIIPWFQYILVPFIAKGPMASL